MSYILKNTQGLLVTRLTDVGRRKISEGNFNISYFQVGDSEVDYNKLVDYGYNNSSYNVLEPPFNAHNNVGIPQSTKNNIKYPLYLDSSSGITYGIPFMASSDESVFNTATPLGFFSACTNNFKPYTSSAWTYNSQYTFKLNEVQANTTQLKLYTSACPDSSTAQISAGTYVTLYTQTGCTCSYTTCRPILTFKVMSVTVGSCGGGSNLCITLDRVPPNLDSFTYTGSGRAFFHPSGMTGYDVSTPLNYWSTSVINYESICTPDDGYVKIWNMNIPWTENPAGIIETQSIGYGNFGSRDYIGTKEYLGYTNSGGQYFYNSFSSTTAQTDTYYYNSFQERMDVLPEDQKAIAIVHYTNNSIINFYGEKFATEVYVDGTNPGEARNFTIKLPWIMWHKNSSCCNGLTLYIDPPGYPNLDLLTPFYMKSSKNSDMNSPGMRYYHLYDTNTQSNGYPNRVGKVFPDNQMIIFDDDEIVAVLNSVSNRNFTLPAPKVGLISPGSCNDDSTDGVLDNDSQCMWVTYGFEGKWQGMHCNYYQKIIGPSSGCGINEQNVTVSFGNEFKCMNSGTTSGFSATDFFILAQTGTTSQSRPSSNLWKKIDYTNQVDNGGIYVVVSALTSTTFVISVSSYNGGTTYNLNELISIPSVNDSTPGIGFGDDYYFYGSLSTDIQATIYEMRYLVNLPSNQFVRPSNPTWRTGQTAYMSEIGLFDSNKNLLALAKFQSPQVRQGVQQVVIKLDF